MESKNTQIAIALTGDSCVGKSAFMERHKTGEFIKEHKIMNGSGLNSRMFNLKKIFLQTNKGSVTINLAETNFPDIKGIDAYILMFDVTRPETYTSIPSTYSKFTNKSAPVVLCGNKVDCPDRKVKCKSITFHREVDQMDYVDLSNKSMYNINLPFEMIIRKLMGGDTYFLH